MMTMNTAKLKAAAEKVRWVDWSAYKPHSGARGYEVRVGSEAVAQHCLKDDAAFIAEASPKTVLCLIAALEAAEKRIAELEQALSAAENNEIDARCHVAELEKRVGELEREREALEAVTLAMRDEMRMAGINLETGGEA
ncbi:ead/Ea22-like family protein [Cronobacter sakazakii]|mgnify:CR=1 FL=1|uniref:ead/Ea22-like family protein n=1 Tax=Cronobacter sakazakii TaxID=28141 RepID=UPI001A982DEF|nr:ead/Ea22-like family protein [Cronobacter sakazakii]ELY2955870.1 ead/Ea22-like family protein [Cronobacter sakazakii]ELZ3146630.1 ead/Ea22-like family protein [Cronobacter sakazakii]EMA5529884.1 ead/Ea22-like family protein [Cronobacter sakazakii]EMC4332221.1 ead/Ea22-like family protein [Cronobacter sakazakii]EMD7613651.1 ead/Ea22-like family protein [Cronobacter sakazakii]